MPIWRPLVFYSFYSITYYRKSSGAVSRVMWPSPVGDAACHLSVWTCCHASIAVYPPPIDEQP